jgi:aminodeoxyfutalosine synthase
MTEWLLAGVDPDAILARITDKALLPIGRKVFSDERLDPQDGLACLQTNDLMGLGSLAWASRTARFGDQAFYIANHHLNYTNICINGCKFCAFHRSPGSTDGYLLSPAEAAEEIASSPVPGLREVHLVGAINPEPGFSYYLEILLFINSAVPGVNLKAFTAVEVDAISQRAGLSWEDCLMALRETGLSMLPGGGAEVFSERVRQQIFPNKIGADSWLGIHATAHRLGIGSNATLLFGHVETLEERVTHLMRLRDQQDETGGFNAFVPLAFHPGNTGLSYLPDPSGVDILKTIATARLVLDNIPHITAYWVMLGMKLASTALYFGADDLEGTIVKERITHQAGASTAEGLSREAVMQCIGDAGFIPVERDTFHRAI